MSNCSCGGTRLVFACSGAADVGALADKVARTISQRGQAKMYCLAGIGAGLPAYLESAKGACGNVTIDGCGVGCAKKIMQNAGITATSFVLTDMGLKKGEANITDELVENTATTIIATINKGATR